MDEPKSPPTTRKSRKSNRNSLASSEKDDKPVTDTELTKSLPQKKDLPNGTHTENVKEELIKGKNKDNKKQLIEASEGDEKDLKTEDAEGETHSAIDKNKGDTKKLKQNIDVDVVNDTDQTPAINDTQEQDSLESGKVTVTDNDESSSKIETDSKKTKPSKKSNLQPRLLLKRGFVQEEEPGKSKGVKLVKATAVKLNRPKRVSLKRKSKESEENSVSSEQADVNENNCSQDSTECNLTDVDSKSADNLDESQARDNPESASLTPDQPTKDSIDIKEDNSFKATDKIESEKSDRPNLDDIPDIGDRVKISYQYPSIAWLDDEDLDFIGFETAYSEKTTMYFRIMDVRLDDKILDEIGTESETEKKDEVHDEILSTTSSTPSLSSVVSASGRRRPRSEKRHPVDVTSAQYLKPFQFGWKRELVYRSVNDGGRRSADVYYYTPKGKKVRSSREVLEHLTDPELSIDNFTFFKEPTAIKDSSKEIIRVAKIRGDKEVSESPPSKRKSFSKSGVKTQISSVASSVASSIEEDPIGLDMTMEIDQDAKTEEEQPSTPHTTRAANTNKVAPGISIGTPKIRLKRKSIPNDKPPAKPTCTPSVSANNSALPKETPTEAKEEEMEIGMLPPVWPSPPEKGTARENSSPSKQTRTSTKRDHEEVEKSSPPPKRTRRESTLAKDKETPTKEKKEMAMTKETEVLLNQEKKDKEAPSPKEKKETPTTKKALAAKEKKEKEIVIDNEKKEIVDTTESVPEEIEEPATVASALAEEVVVDAPSAAASSIEETPVVIKEKEMPSSLHKDFYMTNMSAIYKALLNSFKYLKVQELLRASRVCHLWKDVAHHKSLWQTVRMKNSKVRDWEGFANMLRNSGTKHLDLRKMLVPDKTENQSDMWSEYSRVMERVNMLLRLDMCSRCPTSAVEDSIRYNRDLQVLNAQAIRYNPLNMSAFDHCRNLTELRLKSVEKGGMELINISSMKSLTRLRHLSLLTVKNLSLEFAEVFKNLVNLESLELSECTHLPKLVIVDGLSNLKKLQRLRLEKGHEPCPTIMLLEVISKLPLLVQLELINFDIKPGFDEALEDCSNLKTLLIIPTYVTQSATTNHVVMEGVSKLSKTLAHFVWGITLELLRVTDLFIDQWEGQKSPKSASSGGSPTQKKGSGDSIPILKLVTDKAKFKDSNNMPSQVDILQLPKLHKVLTTLLPNTKIKILKVPFSATWRQTVSAPSSVPQ